MEQKLKASPRSDTGKGAARRVRAEGRVPAILYGRGIEPTSLAVDARELSHLLHTDAGMNVLIDLQVEGEGEHLVLARELQQDHVRNRLVHVDFVAISRDEKITVEVPISVVGDSPGVKEGGVVEHHTWDLEVECLPGDVPENIEADVSNVALGESLHVSDLRPPEGVTINTDPEELVLAVVVPALLKVEAELEEGETAVEGVEGEVAEGAEGEAAAAPAEGESDGDGSSE
jgi:large subunit ribosomal protein L25